MNTNKKHTKWEYKLVDANHADLNALGGEGWELCVFRNINEYKHFILKRPKIDIVKNVTASNVVKHETKLTVNLHPVLVKVGDWVIHKTQTWAQCYQVAKIINGVARLFVNGKVGSIGYKVDTLRVCDENDFVKFPKHDNHLQSKTSVKVGDWAVVIKDGKIYWNQAYLISKITETQTYVWHNGREYPYWTKNSDQSLICDFQVAPFGFPKCETSYAPENTKIPVVETVKKVENAPIKVGDWVVAMLKNGNIKWSQSYLVSKITEDKIYVWCEGKEHCYDIKNSVSDDFSNFKVAPIDFPKYKGSYNPNEKKIEVVKKIKKVNPKNPNNIRKGDWIAISKDTSGSRAYGTYKVHSVKNGELTIVYEGKPYYRWKDLLKTVYKVTKEEMEFYRKIS